MTAFIKTLSSLVIDSFCLFSVVGIWPRFIEPKLLSSTYLNWEVEQKHSQLDGLRIIQFSDLHFHEGISKRFLKKIIFKIKKFNPDLILFTGDFLCYSQLENKAGLQHFLSQLNAPLGCYCTLGNHDYASYVSRNSEGVYEVMKPINPLSGFFRGFRALKEKKYPNGVVSKKAQSVPLHESLLALLKETAFRLLENTLVTLPIGLNIVGLGDYGLGRCRPKTAFFGYQTQYPGIILSHNPDSLPLLLPFPGDLILSGHTHGEQIHFPFPKPLRRLSQKLTRLENSHYSRGLFQVDEQKLLYINRGIGSHKPIRFCSQPELLFITAKSKNS